MAWSALIPPRALAAAADATVVRIGVLAYRGPDEAVASWAELPQQLAAAIPTHRFELRRHDGAALRQAVQHGEVDFVLTNSSQYVDLAANFGVRRIATMMLPEALSPEQAIGSAVLVRADRQEIHHYADLRGKRIATVAPDAFGGYLVAAREFLRRGLDLEKGHARLLFVGPPMLRALEAVEKDEADAAIVRTCLLEQLAAKGSIDPTRFKVVSRHEIPGFRCASSTPLYPDWPMAVARHVDPQLAKHVSLALLLMPPSASALSWEVPADYQSVSELYRELMLGPYADLRTTTFRGILRNYRMYVLVALLILAGAISHVIRVEYLIKRRSAELARMQERARLLEREAEHMARLSILGEMAGTLAHELNQPLATIATYAQGLERRCAAGPVDPAVVADANREIVAQTERADQVIRRVRAFTKKRLAVRECKPIATTVKEAVAMFSHLMPDLPEITIDDWLPRNAQIEADHLQLQEVLLNLMKNAADAMRELPADEREIDITLSKGEGVVSIAVADRGPPVPAGTLAHLFEPFFTTKPDGLGLGLAICKSIAEAHGGRLEVEARNPPPGLVFRIYLPLGGCNGPSDTPADPRR